MTELSQNETIPGSVLVRPLSNVRLIKRTVIVYPLYDADVVGVGERIIIPDSAKNPESQQGIVVAHHDEFEFQLMDTVVYHPYSANDAYGAFVHEGTRYLRIWDHNIVGKVDGRSFMPRSGHVVIEPEWDNLGERSRPGGIIAIDPTIYQAAEPPRFGVVVRLGADCHVLHVGDRVIIPPEGGEEIGWIDHVVYAIPERDILATLP